MEDCMYKSSAELLMNAIIKYMMMTIMIDDNYDVESLDGYPEVEAETTNAVCEKAPSCKVIRKESLLAAQKEELQRVMDLLSLKEHHARSLLIHHRRDVDNVLAVLIDRGSIRIS
ncbi:hypothetical protein K7X08_013729 [Anisodus acutangulus]|uniref:Uncharacterized protein n=1 Tax=Anisodus acutangulus TaxID=402998 RepID=A0A9Q1LKT9_9SOLA|nr:hypothetical protein K7X08_013729 [Anisodus acutangulus]